MTKFGAETRSVHHVLNLQSASFVFQPPSSTPNPFPSQQRNLCYTPCTIHVYLVCSCLIFIFVLVLLLVLVMALWSSFGHLLPSSYSSSSFLLVWPYPLPIVIFILVLVLIHVVALLFGQVCGIHSWSLSSSSFFSFSWYCLILLFLGLG